MDAYVFARSATPAAVETLKSGVAAGGPARVVCPLRGDRALYVAVAADDEEALRERLDAVLATEGLDGTDEYIVGASGARTYDHAAFPTYARVDASIGFSIGDDSAVEAARADVPTVIGAAVATDGTLLLEVTGDDEDGVRRLLDLLPGIARAVGDTADGAGFRRA